MRGEGDVASSPLTMLIGLNSLALYGARKFRKELFPLYESILFQFLPETSQEKSRIGSKIDGFAHAHVTFLDMFYFPKEFDTKIRYKQISIAQRNIENCTIKDSEKIKNLFTPLWGPWVANLGRTYAIKGVKYPKIPLVSFRLETVSPKRCE
ncbi:hypothetical protein ACJX0J_030434, partial [Zea mays]